MHTGRTQSERERERTPNTVMLDNEGTTSKHTRKQLHKGEHNFGIYPSCSIHTHDMHYPLAEKSLYCMMAHQENEQDFFVCSLCL